jgi:tRNA A-37 threonylcarbamoyl transferase component Bud32
MTPQEHARVKELFAAAAQIAPDQRAAWLQQHADASIEVLDEVRSLLKHHTQQTLLAGDDDTQRQTSHDDTRSTTHNSLKGGLLWFKLGPPGYLALGIVVTCLLLIVVNYLTRRATESTLRELRKSTLASGLNITVEAVQLWIDQEKSKIQSVARDPELRRTTQQLVELSRASRNTQAQISTVHQAQIQEQLQADFGERVRYAIWDRQMTTIADWSHDDSVIGAGVTSYGAALLTRVFNGQTVVQMVGRNKAITKDYPRTLDMPTIGLVAPIRDQQNQVLAAILVYGIGAEDRFNELLALIRFGETGEAYAFDSSGLMLSETRFTQQLIDVGLITADQGGSSQRVYVRDPGGDLTRGFRPGTPPSTWPLTTMARFATAGQNGLDLRPYRDYRGVEVVGAWTWLPQYEFGVAMEVDATELNAALRYMRWQSALTLGLLATALGAAVYSYYSLAQLRRQVGTNSLVGQYTLEEKLGEGGMGVVYKARHALLKRPTAIKILKPDVANARTMRWFEREVQLASQLTHPNTIAIYDYGITAAGLFYYVMEYVDGETLDHVVQRQGPLAWECAVRILRQIGGSLREAHHKGLVHRDIKPHNIMLCQRGGETDVVKVLDFGLVKQRSEADEASTVLAGTPRYMAPERISSPGVVNPRIDIYSLGAVGFFLLTGSEIFSEAAPRGILHDVLNTTPPPVTACIDAPIPAGLSELISRCLAKTPDDRPADMESVLAMLDALLSDGD